MKKIFYLHILSLVINFVIGQANFVQPNYKSKYLKDLTIVPGGKVYFNKAFFASNDSTLFNRYPSGIINDSVPSFYISKYEITNAEYRAFVNWVKDSIARYRLFLSSVSEERDNWGRYVKNTTGNYDHTTGNYFNLNWENGINYADTAIQRRIGDLLYPIQERYAKRREVDTRKLIYLYDSLQVSIYPDTLLFNNKYGRSDYNYLLSRDYFWHPAYNDYPVVNISWNQAKAYCKWRTERYLEEINKSKSKKKRQVYASVEFDLPSANEWLRARNFFHCTKEGISLPFDVISKGYICNYGPTFTDAGIPIKNAGADGGWRTVKVNSYIENQYGLYNMQGNVAEWMRNDIDDFYLDDSLNLLKLVSIIEKEMEYNYIENSNGINSKKIYIKNPYIDSTFKVDIKSQKHQSISAIRLGFYNFKINEPISEITEKVLNFYFVEPNYIDSIHSLNSQVKIKNNQRDTNRLFSVYEIVDSRETFIYYNIQNGILISIDKGYLVEKIEHAIKELQIQHRAFTRASNYSDDSNGYNLRFVQGGSWMDPPQFLYDGTEVYHESEASPKIGFRVVMKTRIIEEDGCCLNCSRKDKRKLEKITKYHDKSFFKSY